MNYELYLVILGNISIRILIQNQISLNSILILSKHSSFSSSSSLKKNKELMNHCLTEILFKYLQEKEKVKNANANENEISQMKFFFDEKEISQNEILKLNYVKALILSKEFTHYIPILRNELQNNNNSTSNHLFFTELFSSLSFCSNERKGGGRGGGGDSTEDHNAFKLQLGEMPEIHSGKFLWQQSFYAKLFPVLNEIYKSNNNNNNNNNSGNHVILRIMIELILAVSSVSKSIIQADLQSLVPILISFQKGGVGKK